MRVFIGTVDISSRIRDIARALQKRGIETYTAKRTDSPYYVSDVDCVFSQSNSFNFSRVRPTKFRRLLQRSAEKTIGVQAQTFRKVIRDCDAAIFLFSSIYRDSSDIKILKESGKKVIMIFVGSDVRSSIAANTEFRHYGVNLPLPNESVEEFRKKLRYISISENYSDAIFSRPDQAQLQRTPYLRNVPFLHLGDFHPEFHCRKKPVVLFASRNDPIKGTKIILKAVEDLQSEGVEFSFIRPENRSQFEIREIMRDSDIIIDQLFLPGGGKVSMEGLASGSTVLSRMEYGNYPQLYRDPPPIIDINPGNIKEKLRNVIEDRELRGNISRKGPDFVFRNANIENMVDDIVDILEHGRTHRKADFFPNFLSNFFPDLPEKYRREISRFGFNF